jgi:hypothetical protein
MSTPEPNIPSVPDPFDLVGCSQLPNPLTKDEDQILKHILRICGSDLQMAKRAYDSIICMWAKKGLVPTAISFTPSAINIAAIGNYAQLKIFGTGIEPGANILYKGLPALNPFYGTDATNGPYVSASLDFNDTTKFVTGPIPVAIISPNKILSNSLSIVITVIP